MKEKVVIIGGGIAGMEAAKQLLILGYEPVIVEREQHLGGHVAQWYKLFPDMSGATNLIEDLTSELYNATVYLGMSISFINKLKSGYVVMLSDGRSISARAVLFATGFSLFDASKKEEYGYGVYDHVITNADLEKWFKNRSDARINNPRAIGFVHCVGSRDLKAGNAHCSKVCCTTAIKQAIEMREIFPDAQIYCFYMDLRLFGKKYEDFYISAQRDYGVHFIRGRVSEVSEDLSKRVVVKAEDTLSGKPLKVSLDLLVLMAGMTCNSSVNELCRTLRVDTDSDGFIRSKNNIYSVIESGQEGIFLCGACTGAKTVPETLAEARAAALAIDNYLK